MHGDKSSMLSLLEQASTMILGRSTTIQITVVHSVRQQQRSRVVPMADRNTSLAGRQLLHHCLRHCSVPVG